MTDLRCTECNIPLSVVLRHQGGRCWDRDACAARAENGSRYHVLNAEGVTECEPPEYLTGIELHVSISANTALDADRVAAELAHHLGTLGTVFSRTADEIDVSPLSSYAPEVLRGRVTTTYRYTPPKLPPYPERPDLLEDF